MIRTIIYLRFGIAFQTLSFVLTISQSDLGEPFVLEPGDESPFMKFGYVYAGQTFQALYNNLIRAPLFRQKAYPTDFLVIRLVFSLISAEKSFSTNSQELDKRGDEILPA